MPNVMMSAEFYNGLSFFQLFKEYEPFWWLFLGLSFCSSAIALTHEITIKTIFAAIISPAVIIALMLYSPASKTLHYFDSYDYCKSEKLTKESVGAYVSTCLDSFENYRTINADVQNPNYAIYSMARKRLQSEKLNAEPYDVEFIEKVRSLPTVELHNLSSAYDDSHTYAHKAYKEIRENLDDIEYLEERLNAFIKDSKKYNNIDSYAVEHMPELKSFAKLYGLEKDNLDKNKELFDRTIAHCKRTKSLNSCAKVELIYDKYKKSYENLSSSLNLKEILEVNGVQ